MIEIRPLAGVAWDPLAAAFTEAFGDYLVPMAMTGAGLASMQTRRGVDLARSFGAYEGARLVGFVMTCIEGDRAYNSGTGVVPDHRRTGLARRLMEAAIASIGPRRYVLEVLDRNAAAIALYQDLGFVETRRLECWTYTPSGTATAELAGLELEAIAALGDVAPAWQNSLASLRRAREPHIVIGDADAAAVVFPTTGDVPLLAVAPAARRRGRGRRLLAAAAARAGRPVRIINVDARDAGIAAFMAAVGAAPLITQLEMERQPRAADSSADHSAAT